MFTITKKTAIGAAIAALMGVAAVAGSSQAKVFPVKPGFKLYLACAPGFAKGPGTSSYSCTKYFTPRCKKGMSSSKPYVQYVGGGKYRIAYSCYYPPK